MPQVYGFTVSFSNKLRLLLNYYETSYLALIGQIELDNLLGDKYFGLKNIKYLSNKHCIIIISKHKISENNSVAKKAVTK